MGISFHTMWFLKRAAKIAPLGDVLTFGRQNLNLNRSVLRQLQCESSLDDYTYADSFLIKHLGASSVSSVDYSDFEGASFTADLGRSVDLGRTFDTIIDFGTSEHVFDIAASFRNAISLCSIGGVILHQLPSNSECGHGFYQISPELIFSLYTEDNGFSDTSVYIADLMDERHWWHASRPEPGHRLMANSLSATQVLCRTVKTRETGKLSVFQSDYRESWRQGKVKQATNSYLDRARDLLKGSFAAHVATIGYRSWLARTGLNRFNPHLEKVTIASQLGD